MSEGFEYTFALFGVLCSPEIVTICSVSLRRQQGVPAVCKRWLKVVSDPRELHQRASLTIFGETPRHWVTSWLTPRLPHIADISINAAWPLELVRSVQCITLHQ